MKFFTDKQFFTHDARFYGIPAYLRFGENELELTGTNLVFDWGILIMTWLHNNVIEFGAQHLAALSGQDYEPHFRIKAKPFEQGEPNGK